MSKVLAKTVVSLLRAKGQTLTLTWGGTGDGKGKGSASKAAVTETVAGFISSRVNKVTGESTTIATLPPTTRSLVGATITAGGRSYKVTAVRELRPNDILVIQEADLA